MANALDSVITVTAPSAAAIVIVIAVVAAAGGDDAMYTEDAIILAETCQCPFRQMTPTHSTHQIQFQTPIEEKVVKPRLTKILTHVRSQTGGARTKIRGNSSSLDTKYEPH